MDSRCATLQELRRFVDGSLTPLQTELEMMAHIVNCRECQDRFRIVFQLAERRVGDRRVVNLGRKEGDRRKGGDRRAKPSD